MVSELRCGVVIDLDDVSIMTGHVAAKIADEVAAAGQR
jgi:hypothetical protein